MINKYIRMFGVKGWYADAKVQLNFALRHPSNIGVRWVKTCCAWSRFGITLFFMLFDDL